MFTDLRGFTAFAESGEPEETMEVLAEYHLALGELVFAYEGTLEHFAGDGLLVFFNDPVPCPDAPDRAVRMAVDMRARVAELAQGWRRKGHDLGLRGRASRRATPRSAGSASPAATTTPRSARSPTSPRGCARMAQAGQILVSQRVRHGIVGPVDCREVGPLELKGFSRPVEALRGHRPARGRGVVDERRRP